MIEVADEENQMRKQVTRAAIALSAVAAVRRFQPSPFAGATQVKVGCAYRR